MAIRVFSTDKSKLKEIERLKREKYKLFMKRERLRIENESIQRMLDKIEKRLKELNS